LFKCDGGFMNIKINFSTPSSGIPSIPESEKPKELANIDRQFSNLFKKELKSEEGSIRKLFEILGKCLTNLPVKEQVKLISNIEKLNEVFEKLHFKPGKSLSEFKHHIQDLKHCIDILAEIEDRHLISIMKEILTPSLSLAGDSLKKEISALKSKLKDNSLLSTALDINDSFKNMVKFLNIAMPLSKIKDSNIIRFLIRSHVYENMRAMGHQVELDENNEPLFKFEDRIELTLKDLLPMTEKVLVQQFNEKQKKGEMPLSIYEKGRFKTKLINYKNITLDDYKKHIKIEQIKKIHEMNKNSDAFSMVRVNDKGVIKYERESFKDEDMFDVQDFMRQFFNSKNELNEFLPVIIFPEKKLTLSQLMQTGVIQPNSSLSEGVQYLGSGFTLKSPSEWKFLTPYRILPKDQCPSGYIMDVVVSTKSKTLPMVEGHAYLRLITPGGDIYSFGMDTSEGGLRASKGFLISPDPREFTPKHAFNEVTARYELTEESFGKLIKYIEALKSFDEEGRSTSSVIYQNVTSSCANFAAGLRDFAVKDLKAKRIPHPEKSAIQLTPLQLKIESIKSIFLRNLIICLAILSLKFDFLKKLNIKGFNLAEVEKGIKVGDYENYGSIADEIKRGTFRPYFCRDLALEILNMKS